MSRIYTQQKRPAAKAAAPSYDVPTAHTPSMVSGASSADLDAMMQAKFQQHFLDNQIPHAEAEADRIAASVSGARTPEEVKTQLGEKMGADFSNVTFHTDSAALKQADAMGARAYTTGSDVYFGSGGFDPGVAAHELVHTVQQGMVGSTMGTTSAPAGGVQMLPNPLKAIGRGLKRVGRGIAGIASFPFKMIGALYDTKKARTEQNYKFESTKLLKEYFPAHGAFKSVNAQSRETKAAQTERAGSYLEKNGIFTRDAGQSYNNMLMDKSWGRQFLGLYREGDEANNQALNSLFTVGKAGFNESMMQQQEDGSSTLKDEAFDHLDTLMGPIIQKMMSYDLDNMPADYSNTLRYYNELNELSASANSAFDIRKEMEGRVQDNRYDEMLARYNTNREDLKKRHSAIGKKITEMNRAMGARGGLSTGATQIDKNGDYHVDETIHPEYVKARQDLNKKYKKR